MKCIFIYNPNSGRRTIKKKIDYIESRLKSKYDEVVIYETNSQQDLIDTASMSCDIYDAIFFSGGDGAFNNIIQGIMKKEKRPVLGYIPSGTVCDIAHNIGTSKNVKKALDIMLDGEIVSYDVGVANNTYFVYTQATGTFVSTSYMTSGDKKHKFGKLAYYLGGIKEFFLPTIKKIEIKVANKHLIVNTPLLLILNSRSVAGFQVNRKGKINSGKFDIIVIKNSNSKISGAYNILRFFIRGFFGLSTLKVAYHIKETQATIKCDDTTVWCTDGEEGTKGNIDVEYLPNQFQIYINKKNKKYIGK